MMDDLDDFIAEQTKKDPLFAVALQRAEWEAIRQTVDCPACDGKTWVHADVSEMSGQDLNDGGYACSEFRKSCPDCTDGKIPMARLLAVGAAVFSEDWSWSNVMIGPSGAEAICAVRAHLRAVMP